MRAFAALWRREVFAMLVSPWLYLLLGVWFLLNGFLFVVALEIPGIQRDLSLLPPNLFAEGLLIWLLLPVFPPLLALRSFAEEHRTGTLEPLLTAPIRDVAVVLAKYLAACIFFLFFWGGIALLLLLLPMHGAELDWGRTWGGMFGAVLVSFLFLATGMWASSWGGNLVLAAGGGAALNYILLFLPILLAGSPGTLGDVASNMNIPALLSESFSTGLIDSYAVGYFVVMSLLFLYLTWVRLVSRRWVP